MIFKDPNPIKRSVTKINWHPEATTDLRIGVSYAMLRFQQMPPRMPLNSYIWNLNNPNCPEKTLSPPSALCTMVFNHKISDILVGGSYNGSLSFFDQRKGSSSGVIKPVETTLLEKSHHDPVYDVYWQTVGKSGTECVSTSTDGRLLWWDMKKLGDGPVEELLLSEVFQVNDMPVPKILGGTSLEYNQDAGPLKWLIGTEQGYILQANKRKTIEIQTRFGLESGKHHGPVYALQRNPSHTKFFLSVGDWTAKVWSEELKTPIMQTRYHSSYLTSGCWSPTRCGLFFLTRMDGFLDVWDFFYRQNEVAYSQKISDSPLSTISVQGQMAAIGDADGTVSMMSLCRSLYDQTLQPKEKEIMATIFDREFRREKNLEMAKRQAEIKKPAKKDNSVAEKKAAQMTQYI
jgi:dynein intermediate chain 2, axonemal